MPQKNSTFLFFVTKESKAYLERNSEFLSFTSPKRNVLFILNSDEQIFESLNYLKNRDLKNFIFVETSIFLSNNKFFLDIKNYFNPNIVLIKLSKNDLISKEYLNIFSQKILIDDIAEIFPIFFENSKLENFIKMNDRKIVQDKLVLTNLFFNTLDNITFKQANYFKFKFFYNLGKKIVNNSFWFDYDSENNFIFFDFVLNENKIDIGPVVILIRKEWECFVITNKGKDLFLLIDVFYKKIINSFRFINSQNFGVILFKASSSGEIKYNKINYNNVFEFKKNGKTFFVSGNVSIDNLTDLSSKRIKSYIEKKVLNDNRAEINLFSNYMYMFKVEKKNNVSFSKKQFLLAKPFERNGILKIFDLLDLENIVSIVLDKIKIIYMLKSDKTTMIFINDLKIVLRELVINALEHGVKFNVYKDVLLHYYLKKDKIIFIIEDQGNGFDYKKSGILDKEYRRGKGLFLVKNMVDKLYFNELGNSIRVEFSIKKWREDVFKVNNNYFWNN